MTTTTTKIAGFSVLMALTSMSYAVDVNSVDRTTNDGQLNLYLRAVSINTKLENDLIEDNFGGFPFGNKIGGTAVGAVLDYESPYLNDAFGVDVSLYGVGKVDSRQNSRSLFDDTDGDNEGFGKVGQAHLKLRHQAETWNAEVEAGLGRFDAGTIETLDTRAVPGSYRGSRFIFDKSGLDVGPLEGNLQINGAYIDRASPRDREKVEDLRNLSGERIDNLKTVGLSYDLQAIELTYATGVSKEFNRNSRYGLALKAPIGNNSGILLDAQYYDFEADGELWEQDLSQGLAAYESSAHWANLNLGLLIDNWRFGASWTKAKAELNNGQVGYAYFDHADNVDGRLDVWTRPGNDFNNDGEEAWQLAAEYNFDDKTLFNMPLNGVKMLVTYKYGSFDATNPLTGNSEDVSERQYEYRLYYHFEEKNYTGLSAGLIFTDYEIDEDFVALVSAQPDNVVTGQELRVYLDYAF